MGITNCLVELGNPENIGMAMRTSHVLGGDSVNIYVHDPLDIIGNNLMDIECCSTGVFSELGAQYRQIRNLERFLRGYDGRVIATELSERAVPITEFEFEENDLILYGSERTGLRGEVIRLAHKSIIVPMIGDYTVESVGGIPNGPDEMPNLNVAATLAIVTFEALSQLGYLSSCSSRGFQRDLVING